MRKAKYREISLEINEEDIKDVCAILLTNIYTRKASLLNKQCEELSLHLSNNDSKAILKILQQSISSTALFSEELISLAPLVKEIQPEELSTYTEVLKDLPNLKEDSLGVDGGSE